MEEARQLRPSDDKLLFRLASLQYDLQRYDLARSFAQEALALAPSEWLYHYLAGLIAKAAGQWPEARASLETAARLNASAAEVQNALGEVSQHDGDRERAIAAFERAVSLNPGERAYRLNLEAAHAYEVEVASGRTGAFACHCSLDIFRGEAPAGAPENGPAPQPVDSVR